MTVRPFIASSEGHVTNKSGFNVVNERDEIPQVPAEKSTTPQQVASHVPPLRGLTFYVCGALALMVTIYVSA
jgi:hypothetical protein